MSLIRSRSTATGRIDVNQLMARVGNPAQLNKDTVLSKVCTDADLVDTEFLRSKIEQAMPFNSSQSRLLGGNRAQIGQTTSCVKAI